MPATALNEMNVVEQARLVREGEVSARELVEATLEQIDRANGDVNAFVALAPDRALAEADAIRPGDERPLCGVPVGIKDLLSATVGLPTTEGSAAFGDWVADHDGAHVRRLREAGAIVVGKTNTPELGLRPVTENARFGVTRNPRNIELSAGGSSGGSAAAIASQMVSLADGSDFGGSIRIPASCCGVVGLKPSRGRVSIGPDLGDIASGIPVNGPLARTVEDAALALDVMAGYEPGDAYHLDGYPAGFADAARTAPPRTPVRVALHAPLGVSVDAEPRRAAELAAGRLAAAGQDVEEWAPDWDDEAVPAAWGTFATGGLQHLIRVVERLHGRPMDAANLEPATRSWVVDGPQIGLVDYLEAGERLWGFRRRLLRSWPPGAVLLTPTLTRLPAPAASLQASAGVTDDAVRFSALVRIWNVTGQPAISLPLHETDDGVPVGVQLIGPPGRDDLVVALGAQLEQGDT
ncbi:MAG TPA: amidase [Gaiellales bacterium]|nr:amidase [Gaiellales bacterium]